MTVAELGNRMDAREEMEWIAFWRLEPFGPTAADYRAGVIAATIANVHRGRGQQARQPSDFFPTGDKPSGTMMSPEALQARLQRAGFQFVDARK